MRLESSFSVRAPIDEVWAAVVDVERVVPCVPGARVLERLGDDRFEVALDVALGAPAVSYQGEVAIVEQQAADRRAVLSITADGDQPAEARVELTLLGAGELTEAKLAAEVSAGPAVEIDRDEIRAVVARLVDDFARNLAALLGGGVPTVNGSDPASSIARLPEPVGETRLGVQPVAAGPAAPAAARAAAAEDPREARPVGGEQRRDTPPAAAPPSPQDASWAGATRQAAGTIERLRSPLGALLVALVAVGAVFGWRRRTRELDGPEPVPPTPPAPAA